MKLRDLLILFAAILVATGWVIFSGKDGFKVPNGMIVARSIPVVSTIEGTVELAKWEVGTKVVKDQLLASIQNHRIDLSRTSDLQSQYFFLRSEIENAKKEREGLTALHKKFEKRRISLLAWRLKDLRLRQSVMDHELKAAAERSELKTKEVQRTRMLFKKAHISNVNLDTAVAEAAIAKTALESAKANLARARLLIETANANDTIIFEDGETSYWDKTIDELNLRLFDNSTKLMTLQAEQKRNQAQLEVENARMKNNFIERHRAPFNGVVNAVFVANGARVNTGTPLFQVLDCSHPVAIVPIPEHRFSEFSVGQKVTVQPIDSERTIRGTIKLMSNGALLGRDTTLAVQQDMTITGPRVVVGFDAQNRSHASVESCESARKAQITIHTISLFDKMAGWFHEAFPKTAFFGREKKSIPAS